MRLGTPTRPGYSQNILLFTEKNQQNLQMSIHLTTKIILTNRSSALINNEHQFPKKIFRLGILKPLGYSQKTVQLPIKSKQCLYRPPDDCKKNWHYNR